MNPDLRIKKLFGSRTRLKLIKLFFDKNEAYYVRQITRLCGEEINSVRRELGNLHKIGFLKKENRSNKIFYSIKDNSMFREELFLMAMKTKGLIKKIISNRRKIGKIKLIVVSRKFAGDEIDPQLDILIIGSKMQTSLIESMVKNEESKLGHEIKIMINKKKELKTRLSMRDPFLIEFLIRAPMFVFGNPDKIL